MKTLKLKDLIDALRRTYPKIDPATRFMYSGRLLKRTTSYGVAVHVIAWSDDGRVTLHKTQFRRREMTVTEWSTWLHAHAPKVLNNQVRAYMSRTFGSRWYIHKIFGWHFVEE